jgi:hypothetical protein
MVISAFSYARFSRPYARLWMGEWFQLPALEGSRREKNSDFCSRKRTSLFLCEHINVTIGHPTEYFVVMVKSDLMR